MSNQHKLIQDAMQQMQRVRATSVLGGETRALDQQIAARLVPIEIPELDGYTIEREIHRGGQGVVLRGIQHATGRAVAIKVMHGGALATDNERHRFDQEVRVLAEIDHPNIVTIHDSGVLDGVAYYIMDLVHGLALHQHVPKCKPTLSQRVELIATIAEAVNAAHLNGVIHRDLKPGNICVKSNGMPVVLDFGLAKRTSRTVDETMNHMTETGAFVGSLPWASPEQAEGEGNIDIRTDVYSLGVVAYQLMTGEFPYDVSGSITRTAKAILTSEPTPPRRLNPELDDEVATILMKAIRKDREERYQNAGEFARDLRRYMNGDPIEAKGDSVMYWLKKQLIRHKVVATFIAILTAVVLLGFVVSTYYWRTAEAARQVASRQKILAEEMAEKADLNAERAMAVSEFLVDVIASSDPNAGGRNDVTVKEVMQNAVRELNGGSLEQQPQVEGAVRAVVAKSYASLGLYDESREQSEASARLYKQSGNVEERIESESEAAHMLCELEKLDEALERYRNILDIAMKAFGPTSAVLSPTLQGRARVFKKMGKVQEAENDLRRAIELMKEEPAEEAKRILPLLWNDLAVVMALKGENQEAIKLWERGFQQLDGDASRKYLALGVKANLASDLAKQRQFAKAESLLNEAITGLREMAGERSPIVASCLSTLSNILTLQNRHKEALALLEDSLSIRQELLGENHPLVANSKNGIAIIAYHVGKLNEAKEYFDDAIRIYTSTRGPDDPKLATILQNSAAVERAANRMDEALALCRRALEINHKHFGDDSIKTADSMHRVGRLLQETGEPRQAVELLSTALQIRHSRLGSDDLLIAESKESLALALADQGKLEEAIELGKEAFDQRKAKMSDNDVRLADSQLSLSILYDRSGEYDKARQFAKDALQLLHQSHDEGHWRIATFRAHYANVLGKAGEIEKANAMFKKLLAEVSDDMPDTLRGKLDKALLEFRAKYGAE